MKTTVKYSLWGGLAGAIVMLVAVIAIEWALDRHPALDKQVVQYLEREGYSVDSIGNDIYVFEIGGNKVLFDYYPSDKQYLYFCIVNDMTGYSYEELVDACMKTNGLKKNICTSVSETEEGYVLYVTCSSFVEDGGELDEGVLDRTIHSLMNGMFYCMHVLNHGEE